MKSTEEGENAGPPYVKSKMLRNHIKRGPLKLHVTGRAANRCRIEIEPLRRRLRIQSNTMAPSRTEKTFTRIYRNRAWDDGESRSGPGSGVARTAALRPRLTRLLLDLGVGSILDLPCGDFNWMRLTELPGIEYTGADIVAPLIEQNSLLYSGPGRRFLQLDMVSDLIPRADLILCRDGLVHLSFFDIAQALTKFHESGATYFLTTTFTAHVRNMDIVTGGWRRLNFGLAPFCFPPPLQILTDARPDGTAPDKMLALYRWSDLSERLLALQWAAPKNSRLAALRGLTRLKAAFSRLRR